jgi:glycosyltransferase involved in cell wall biosynthesis
VHNKPVVVAFPFIGDEIGGSHISAINLIAGLNTSCVMPLIVLHQPDGMLAGYLTDRHLSFIAAPNITFPRAGLQNTTMRTLLSGGRIIRNSITLSAFLQRNRVDIVHTNDGSMHATWALPARLSGAKLLWHHRGDPTARGVNTLAPFLANHVVTVSRFARPTWPIVPVAKRLTVVHSPFDHPVLLPDRQACRQSLLRELEICPDTRLVGYVGGLIDRKRPVAFVDIIKAFCDRTPQVPLAGLLFGINSANGPDLEEAVRRRAAELGIRSSIHLMGFRSDISACMAGLDALLVPAVNEPFGRTLIEAMLLGTPVIATRHGGNPEAIEDGRNGFLVTAENPEAFVPPLQRILTKPDEWQRISETACSRAMQNYGRSAHVEAITALYARLMTSRKTAS